MKQIGAILFGLATVAAVFGGQTPLGTPSAPPSAAPAAVHQSNQPNRFAAEGISVARDATGQFHLELAVNGTPTRFLIDTGADLVALTMADAERAGLPVDPGAFRPILRTASGEGLGARVRLERLEIGQVELRDIDAVVVQDLDTSLLGQTVLARMGRVELSGDRMVLEPKH